MSKLLQALENGEDLHEAYHKNHCDEYDAMECIQELHNQVKKLEKENLSLTAMTATEVKEGCDLYARNCHDQNIVNIQTLVDRTLEILKDHEKRMEDVKASFQIKKTD